MTISNELLDERLKGCKRPEDLLGDAGLMKELKIRLMERILGGELTAHLGYESGAAPPAEQTNRGNEVATKRVTGSDGEAPLSVPRDREGSFEPELVKKGQTRIDVVDDKIIGLYAAGLSLRDIQAHLEDLYGLRVSPDLISRVADLCRKHGVSDATVQKWKAKYGGMDVSEAKRLKGLEDENARLKRLLADAMLDNAALKDLLGKSGDVEP